MLYLYLYLYLFISLSHPLLLAKKDICFSQHRAIIFFSILLNPPPISFNFCTIFTYYFVSQIDCPSKMHDPFFYLFFQRIVRVHSLSCTTSFSSSTIRLFPCIIFSFLYWVTFLGKQEFSFLKKGLEMH